LFLKEHSACKNETRLPTAGALLSTTVIGMTLVLLVASCAMLMEGSAQRAEKPSAPQNRFTVAPHVAPPPSIQSLQLYRSGSPANPPVIRLGSGEQLTLAFDRLDTGTEQFIARISHYSSRWEESGLNPNYYIDGFFEDYFGGGLKSFSQRPSYLHYEYSFPNSRFSISVSGNYLLSVYDAGSDRLLFALPFFVTEDEGDLESRVEKRFARRRDMREQDQLFSRYRYPPFVEMPSFDLSFVYVQNRFWGRSSRVQFFDTSTPGIVHFHQSQEDAFLGDYEFKTLDLRSFTADADRIIGFDPTLIPPQITLRRDQQAFETGFLSKVGARPGTRFGLPVDDRDARYANVQFKLETRENSSAEREMYLVGDFNGWTIDERNRMEFNRSENLWEGSALIKQGEYAYKYVTLEEGRIDDLALDRSFTYSRQEYFTLVYFRDPVRHFDRLLIVDRLP